MKKDVIILLAGLLLWCSNAEAQNLYRKADSLLSALNTAQSASAKMKIHHTLGQFYLHSDIEKARYHARQLTEVSPKKAKTRGQFLADLIRAKAELRAGNQGKARRKADEAFDLSIKRDKKVWYARALELQAIMSISRIQPSDAEIQTSTARRLFNEANQKQRTYVCYAIESQIAKQQFNTDKAYSLIRKAISGAVFAKDSLNLLVYKNQQADLLFDRGDFARAFSLYTKIYQEQRMNQLDYDAAATLTDLGRIYIFLKNFEKASETLDKAFTLAVGSGNKPTRAWVELYRGDINYHNGFFREGLKKYKQAAELFSHIKDYVGMKEAHRKAGHIYRKISEYKNAARQLRRARKIKPEYVFERQDAFILAEEGMLALETGNERSGVEKLEKSNSLAREINEDFLLKKNYERLSQYYTKQNNVELAYEYLRKHKAIQDKLFDNTIFNQLLKIQGNYEQKLHSAKLHNKDTKIKWERRLQALEKEKSWLIILILTIGAAALLLLVYQLLHRKNKSGKTTRKAGKITDFRSEGYEEYQFFQYFINGISLPILWLRGDSSIYHYNKALHDLLKIHKPYTVFDILPISNNEWKLIRKQLREKPRNVIVRVYQISRGTTKPKNLEVAFCSSLYDGFHGIVAFVRGSTSAKVTEQELLQTKKRAEESDRLNSVFLANISHEIRTPVNAIDGFTHELRTETDPAQRNHYIEQINVNTHRLIKLMDNLLDLSLVETDKLVLNDETFDILPVFRELTAYYNARIQESNKDVFFQTQYPKNVGELYVHTDKDRLYLVIYNLLSNAVKFTTNGSITLGCQTNSNNRQITIFVKDTGPGIPPENQQHIFGDFHQQGSAQTRKYQGAGVGLSLSKKLIERMNGRLYFESRKGKGSTFYVQLPRLKGTGQAAHPTEKDTAKDEACKILLIDDSPTNTSFMKAVLKSVTHNIVTENNIREGIHSFQTNPADLVVVSYEICNSVTMNIASHLKSIARDTAVVAFGASSDKNCESMDDIIPHQTSRKEFIERIVRLLN